MGQSEIGIDVDLDPDSPWWETLLKVLAVIAVGVAIIALIATLGPGLAAIWTGIKAVGTFLAASGLTSVIVVGGAVVAASSLLASRIFGSYVFAVVFVFTRGNI